MKGIIKNNLDHRYSIGKDSFLELKIEYFNHITLIVKELFRYGENISEIKLDEALKIDYKLRKKYDKRPRFADELDKQNTRVKLSMAEINKKFIEACTFDIIGNEEFINSVTGLYKDTISKWVTDENEINISMIEFKDGIIERLYYNLDENDIEVILEIFIREFDKLKGDEMDQDEVMLVAKLFKKQLIKQLNEDDLQYASVHPGKTYMGYEDDDDSNNDDNNSNDDFLWNK